MLDDVESGTVAVSATTRISLPEPDFNLMDYVLTTTGFGGPPVKDADKYRAADHAKWHREHPARPCERDLPVLKEFDTRIAAALTELQPVVTGNAAELVAHLSPFDLVVTDPPYAMGGVDGEWRLTAEVAIALRDMAKVIKKRDGAMIVLAASSGRSIEFMSSAVGLPLKRVLTWHRPDARTAARSGWRFDTVLALVFGKVPPLGGDSSFVSAASPKPSGHKAEVPPEVADWLLSPWRYDGPFLGAPTMLDPFCGSGAFLAAAKRAGHKVIGIDKEQRWVEYANERLIDSANTL